MNRAPPGPSGRHLLALLRDSKTGGNRTRPVFVLLLAALSLAATVDAGPGKRAWDPLFRESEIPFIPVDAGNFNGIATDKREFLIIGDATSWSQFWVEQHPPAFGGSPAPRLDFAQNWVAVLLWGQSNIVQDIRALAASYTGSGDVYSFLYSASNCELSGNLCLPSFSRAYQAIQVPRVGDGPVRAVFVCDETGEVGVGHRYVHVSVREIIEERSPESIR